MKPSELAGPATFESLYRTFVKRVGRRMTRRDPAASARRLILASLALILATFLVAAWSTK